LAAPTQANIQITHRGSANIDISYHEAKDETVVRTKYMLAAIPPSSALEGIRFYASYKYPSKEPRSPDTIDLNFMIEPCEHNLGITIWVDGKELHSASLLGFCFASSLRDRLMSTISLPCESFRTLAESENAEIEIQGTRFKLLRIHTEVLNELLQEMSQ
jgi:hypothetical protein